MTTSTQKKKCFPGQNAHTDSNTYAGNIYYFLDIYHRVAVSVLTWNLGAFVSSAVGVPPSLETLPKSRTFRRPLTPMSSLQPNRTAVSVATVKIFGNPQHQQHGEQHHQQTYGPHGNVSGGRAIRGCPFNHTDGLQTGGQKLPYSKTPTSTTMLPKETPWDPSDTLTLAVLDSILNPMTMFPPECNWILMRAKLCNNMLKFTPLTT